MTAAGQTAEPPPAARRKKSRPPPSPAATLRPADAPDALAVYAEPISPDTARRFEHLRALQGHVLIGGGDTQVVLAGIGARAPGQRWQPAVLAAFARRGGFWRALSSLGGVDLLGSLKAASSDGYYYATGVDVAADKDRRWAFASFVYASTASPRRLAVTYRLDTARARLTVLFSSIDAPGAVGAVPLWQMRLRGGDAGTGVLAAAAEMLGNFRGSIYLQRYRDADVSSVVGFRPFDAREQLGELVLVPSAGEAGAPPVEGYEILLGRDASLGTHGVAAAVRSCSYGERRPDPKTGKTLSGDDARLAWLASCEASVTTGLAALQMPADDAGGEQVSQPVYVFGRAETPLVYTALRAGETVVLALPAEPGLRLADTRSGREFPGAPLQLVSAAPPPAPLALPARSSGKVRLAPGARRKAAILTVDRLDRPKGDAGVLGFVPEASVTRLSSNTYLVRSWPIELTLLTGGYAVRVATGSDGGFCELRANVEEAKPVELTCPEPEAKPAPARSATFVDLASDAADTANRSAAIATTNLSDLPGTVGGRPVPLALGGDSTRGALALDAASLRALTGAAWVAVGPEVVASPGNIPVLRAYDADSDLMLSLWPASAALANAWRDRSQARGVSADALGAFARFARSESPDGMLELSCPAPGMSVADYERLASRLAPDAVRLFGCWQPAAQSEPTEFLEMLGRLNAKRPLLVTPVPSLAYAGWGDLYPRIALFTADGGAPPAPDPLLKAIHDGRYTLASGATLEILGMQRAAPPESEITLDLGVSAAAGVSPRELVVASERGVVHREALPAAGASQRLKATVPSARDAAWLRVELRGTVGGVDGVLLATTNFFPKP